MQGKHRLGSNADLRRINLLARVSFIKAEPIFLETLQPLVIPMGVKANVNGYL
jgi:hypothetical protein